MNCQVCNKELKAKKPGTLKRKKYCDELCKYRAKEIKRKSKIRENIKKMSIFN